MAPLAGNHNVLFVSGISGSGKSYFVGSYLSTVQDFHPDTKIKIYSQLDGDSAYTNLNNAFKVDLSPENELIYENEVSDLKTGDYCVFDDIDSIANEKLCKRIYELIKQMVNLGRHAGISVIFVNHTLKDFLRTKYILAEATHFVVFPNCNVKVKIIEFLREQLGLSLKQAKELLSRDLKTRYFLFSKSNPLYYLTENEAGLLGDE